MHSLELCKVRMDPQLSAIRERSSADWVSASVPDVAQFLFFNHLFRCFFSLYSNQFLLNKVLQAGNILEFLEWTHGKHDAHSDIFKEHR